MSNASKGTASASKAATKRKAPAKRTTTASKASAAKTKASTKAKASAAQKGSETVQKGSGQTVGFAINDKGQRPYGMIGHVYGLDKNKSAYTVAAAAHLGLIDITPEGTVTRPKRKPIPGAYAHLKRYMHSSNYTRTVRDQGYIDESKNEMTDAGIAWMASRLNQTAPAYRTTADLVHALIAGMAKGGKVTFENGAGTKAVLDFKHKITA